MTQNMNKHLNPTKQQMLEIAPVETRIENFAR